jgi:hypothetical protein
MLKTILSALSFFLGAPALALADMGGENMMGQSQNMMSGFWCPMAGAGGWSGFWGWTWMLLGLIIAVLVVILLVVLIIHLTKK